MYQNGLIVVNGNGSAADGVNGLCFDAVEKQLIVITAERSVIVRVSVNAVVHEFAFLFQFRV